MLKYKHFISKKILIVKNNKNLLHTLYIKLFLISSEIT